MLNKKASPMCQTILHSKQQHNQILKIVFSYNNHVIVYRNHLTFNQSQTNYDRNSKAYSTISTVEKSYLLITVCQPHALVILNMESGDIFVARGLQQISDHQILAFSVQPDLNKSSTKKTKKFNILLNVKGSIILKVVQMEPKIDSNPKTRFKIIQQNAYSGYNMLKCRPIFCNLSWNSFIICKNQLIVFLAFKKNEQIAINLSIQLFDRYILRLFSSFNILGFAESKQTWGVLSGNQKFCNEEKLRQNQISINIFWQHKSNNQISQKMYFRDDSFIKSLSLPCNQQQFVTFWEIDGYYLIQTKSNVSHRCYIIHEGTNSATYITINLLANSQLCCHSLQIKDQSISIWQIQNKKQLYKTRVYQKILEDNIQKSQGQLTDSKFTSQDDKIKKLKFSESTTNEMTDPYLSQMTEYSESNKLKDKITEQIIKKYQTKNQVSIDLFSYSNSESAEIKNTLINSNKLQMIQPVTTFVNEKIIQHLVNKKQLINSHSSQGSDIIVPNSVQRLVSFGTPNNLSKIQYPNQQRNFISFGNNKKAILQNSHQKEININSIDQKNSKKQSYIQENNQYSKKELELKHTQKQQIKINNQTIQIQFSNVRLQLQKIAYNISQQLCERKYSLNDNYLNISQQLKISFQTIFTPQEQKFFKSQVSRLELYYLSQDKKKKRNYQNNKILNQQIAFAKFVLQQSEKWLYHLGAVSMNKAILVPQLQHLNKFSIAGRKIIFQDQLLKKLSKFTASFFLLERKANKIISQLLIKSQLAHKKKLSQRKSSNNKSLTLKQIFNLINGSPIAQKKVDKNIKIPILRSISINQKKPLLQMTPLQQ